MMSTGKIKDSLVFMAPMVGPKVYLSRGSSGWPETFERKHADAALADFLGGLAVTDLVEVFVTRRALEPELKPITWFTVTGFLGRTLEVSPLEVPQTAAIAFWAHVVMATSK